MLNTCGSSVMSVGDYKSEDVQLAVGASLCFRCGPEAVAEKNPDCSEISFSLLLGFPPDSGPRHRRPSFRSILFETLEARDCDRDWITSGHRNYPQVLKIRAFGIENSGARNPKTENPKKVGFGGNESWNFYLSVSDNSAAYIIRNQLICA